MVQLEKMLVETRTIESLHGDQFATAQCKPANHSIYVIYKQRKRSNHCQ